MKVLLGASILMSDSPPAASTPCDGIDHGLPPDRVGALDHDAYNFNQVLKANETDGTGKGNLQVALAAGRAFFEELADLPVGERKALLKLAESYNKMEQNGDPAMPTIDHKMDSDAFLEHLIVRYPEPFYPEAAGQHRDHTGEKASQFAAEFFDYQGRGMCAEYPQPGATSTFSAPAPWPDITLPSLNLGWR
jgi:hypothetical protein